MTSGPPRRAILATAGHVDHGKTALIRALTGTDTDRLPEEKRRGISIELGFAELAAASPPVSFIDVPGHRKLVHAMIAGVGGVDGLLLCVAADDGVMPQTREHLQVAKLLGIRRVLVALTKRDLVDGETFDLAESDVRATLEALGLEVVEVVATSVVTREGLDSLVGSISGFASALEPRRPTALAWLAADRVFTIKGAGTIVTGTLTRGRLEVGATTYVHGPDGTRESSCRSLEVHGESVGAVEAPSRVAINLARVETTGVRRGDVVSTDSALPVSDRIDVALDAVPGFEDALEDGSPAVVHVGTDRASARVHAIAPGLAQLSLESPLACFGGLGFVLRGFSVDPRRGAVIGGGRILDARAERLPARKHADKRDARRRALELVRAEKWSDAARAFVELAAPRPLASRDVEHRLGLEPGVVTAWLDRADSTGVVVLANGSYIAASALDELEAGAIDIVEGHQRRSPHDAGMSLETLRSELARRTSREAVDRAIARAEHRGALVAAAPGVVSTPAFVDARREEVTAEVRRVLAVLDAAGAAGLGEHDVVARSELSSDTTRSTLARLSSAQSVRRLGGLWFSEHALDGVRRRVAEHFDAASELSVAAFKDLVGVSRKQAIPLLEQLDREGTTRRAGDTRLPGSRLAK